MSDKTDDRSTVEDIEDAMARHKDTVDEENRSFLKNIRKDDLKKRAIAVGACLAAGVAIAIVISKKNNEKPNDTETIED